MTSPEVVVYTVVLNEAHRLPGFVEWYRAHLRNCSFVVFDNGSTDGSAAVAADLGASVRHLDTGGVHDVPAMLSVKNHAWKGSPADWVIVCDVDEFLQVTDERLVSCDADIVQAVGYDMIGDGGPLRDIRRGVRSPLLDKFLCFRPSALDEINYDPGCHQAHPIGRDGRPLRLTLVPMFHFRWTSLDAVLGRNRLMVPRRGQASKENGWGAHYAADEEHTRRLYTALASEARAVPSLVGDPFGGDCFLYLGELPTAEPGHHSWFGLAPGAGGEADLDVDPCGPLPFLDGSFPWVLSKDGLHLVPEALVPHVLDEIHRILRPGGRFRLTVPDYDDPEVRERCVFDHVGRIVAESSALGGPPIAHGGVLAGSAAAPRWFPTADSLAGRVLASRLRHCRDIRTLRREASETRGLRRPPAGPVPAPGLPGWGELDCVPHRITVDFVK